MVYSLVLKRAWKLHRIYLTMIFTLISSFIPPYIYSGCSTLWTHEIKYHLVIQHSHGKSLWIGVFMGKSSINGPFSMAMLNNQRVNLQWFPSFFPIFHDISWWMPRHVDTTKRPPGRRCGNWWSTSAQQHGLAAAMDFMWARDWTIWTPPYGCIII